MINNYNKDIAMKSLKHYLAESEKTYEFKIRSIAEMTDEQLDKLENFLAKYDLQSIGAPKKTIIQRAPYGFEGSGPAEVHMIDLVTRLPVTSNVLHDEISRAVGISMSSFLVHTAQECNTFWEQMHEADSVPTSVLADPDYKEAEKVDHKNYYGNDFVAKFVNDLPKNELSKEYKVK